MTQLTPRSAAPADVRRVELVAETMDGLVGVDRLPLAEQAARLDVAQRTLAAVLSNDPSVAQPGIPGVPR
ncbi:hypothetical protein [Tessaracoccus palaemonis]|uniref:Uncharacterized protein n=1 Tax=Tessaracoccus palaemonis TaxID=2829499 RepID=A0ABX8SMM6_9ACTN|nr:hypothetical protein [Tessaracoccus palaemonis]QXT63895.1 hypothetical protein KDB89_05390 [Tessaracoccus palaemonis]